VWQNSDRKLRVLNKLPALQHGPSVHRYVSILPSIRHRAFRRRVLREEPEYFDPENREARHRVRL
jgi:hypothetical protein